MYPLILVPLDGSPFAEGALPAAVMLAARHQAPLHLVAVHSVIVRPLDMPGAPVYDSAIDDDRRRELDAYLERTAARLTGELGREVSCASVVQERGSTASAIIDEAVRRGAGLVVLSTHGRGGFSRAWLGSVASELLRSMPVPTLIIRSVSGETPTSAPALGHVLLPLDGSELAAAAVEPALAMAAPFGSRFTVLRVVRTSESQLPYDQTFWTAAEEKVMEDLRLEAQRDVDAVVDDLRARGRTADGVVVLDSDAARTILRVSGERGVDLIAISTRGHSGLTRLLIGSVTDKVVRGAEQPVLVVRPAQTE